MRIFVALLLGLAGCGGSKSPAVADQPAAFVQPTPDDAVAPANLGCLGAHADPAAPATATDLAVTVKDFEKSTPVAGATVEVYLSLAHLEAGAPDGASAPTDADGKTTLTVPPGAYRVIFRTFGAPNTIETLELDRAYDDAARVSVSEATKSEIPALLNLAPDDTKGVVAGSQRDCDERELGGITVTMSAAAGSYDSGGNVFYFQDAGTTRIPSRPQKWTSGDGAFAGLNVPPGNATVVARGLPSPGAAATNLGTAVVPVRAGSITIVQLEPLGPGQ
jgi:hypothetical protein